MGEGGIHTDHVLGDVAARVGIRSLVDTYAAAVDRADAAAVAALFSDGGSLIAHFHTGADGQPVVRRGRGEIAASIEAGLTRYLSTTHVVGGQAVDIDGTEAHGETTCLAHHLYERDGEHRLLVFAVRYEDDFVCEAGTWRFARRQLRLDWREDRAIGGGGNTVGETAVGGSGG
jgi:ketosteroid isomerase-like protein